MKVLKSLLMEMSACPLMDLKTSTKDLNMMQVPIRSQWGETKRGVTSEHLGWLNIRCAAAFSIVCSGLIAQAGRPASRELQWSRSEVTNAWKWAAYRGRKGPIFLVIQGESVRWGDCGYVLSNGQLVVNHYSQVPGGRWWRQHQWSKLSIDVMMDSRAGREDKKLGLGEV